MSAAGRLVIAASLLAACGKDARTRALAIAADRSIEPTVAIERAAHVLWPDSRTVERTIWVEPDGGTYRLFIVSDEPGHPYVDAKADRIELQFGVELTRGGEELMRVGYLVGPHGKDREVVETLFAHRFHCDVMGRPVVVVEPLRVRESPPGFQELNGWEPADLEKLKPYDLEMGKTGQVAIPPPI